MHIETVKELLAEGRGPEALALLLREARLTDDYGAYMGLCRLRRRIGPVPAGTARMLRIALLGGASTDFLETPLSLELETIGVRTELFRGNFGTHAHEMLDSKSATVGFRPDVAVLILTHSLIAEWPATGDSPENVASLVRRTCAQWLAWCDALHANAHCDIVVGNLHLLPARVAGNLGCRLPWDPNNFLRQVNAELGRHAPQYVHLLDVETLSAIFGVVHWFDPRYWHHSKQPVSFACTVPFARNLAGMIGALYGQTAKCIVVDLDNTIWGGVVGDDGIGGLRIGEGDAESEAFKAFQEYLLCLGKRGILLAVSSKNEEANALAPFDRLPEMVLKRDDFVAFKANWRPKSEALVEIAHELNIGLDALVFVDDNPAERELVRQSLPQVKVVELSGDPSDYPRLLDQSGWLEVVRVTDEDRRKTEQYRENRIRRSTQTQYADYGAYLASLDQKAVIRPFEREHLERIAQLINKTNQFNLTTLRLTRSDVEAMLERPDVLTASVRLVDRFGDNGIISAFSGHLAGKLLHIDLWLMSCRVFKRGVEHLLANYVFEQARRLGAQQVRGVYIPSAKNAIVATFYEELGFVSDGTAQDGTSSWSIRIDDFAPINVYIALQEDDGA